MPKKRIQKDRRFRRHRRRDTDTDAGTSGKGERVTRARRAVREAEKFLRRTEDE